MYAIGNHIHNIKKGVRTPTYAMRTYFSRAKLPIRLDIIFTPEKKKKIHTKFDFGNYNFHTFYSFTFCYS